LSEGLGNNPRQLRSVIVHNDGDRAKGLSVVEREKNLLEGNAIA
jgi:hypothetical protein